MERKNLPNTSRTCPCCILVSYPLELSWSYISALYVTLQFAFTALEESVISGDSSSASVAVRTRIWVNIPRCGDSRKLKASLDGRVVFQSRGKVVFSPWPRTKMADSVSKLSRGNSH